MSKKLYTLGEEIFSSVTHGVGALLSIAGLVIMIVISALDGSPIKIITSSIFGISLIVLYTMSTLYHSISNEKAKNVLKVFDHCTIYLLIAGSYTPFSLLTIGSINPKKGWIVFSIVWIIAILGTLLYIFKKNKFKILNILSYIIMGWVVVIALPELLTFFKVKSSMGGLYLLLAGVIFYALQKKNLKYFHSIWHLFVLGGSICQFLSLVLYVL